MGELTLFRCLRIAIGLNRRYGLAVQPWMAAGVPGQAQLSASLAGIDCCFRVLIRHFVMNIRDAAVLRLQHLRGRIWLDGDGWTALAPLRY
jgi:hypothetical protein